MSNGVNLRMGAQLDYTGQIASILSALGDGPKLAHQLPKRPSALIEAEALGLAKAERWGTRATANAGSETLWRWSITQAGRQWLKERSGTRGASTEAAR